MKAGNDAAALDGLADFFAAPAPLRPGLKTDKRAVQLYAGELTRWLGSKSGSVSPDDRRRIERYREQIVDRGLDVRAEVKQ